MVFKRNVLRNGKGVKQMVDFSNCEIEPLRVYDGANGKKICVIYNGERYMLKFPALARNNPEMHYSNGCLNEHIASSIYRTLDIETQETILGLYNDKTVVACKDFCDSGERIVNFAMIKNACIDSSLSGYGTELSEVLQSIEEQQLYAVEKIRQHFWRMFVADAFLGNFDRHNGNWGIIVNELTRDTRIAPVYDNGSCLYPQLTDTQMEKILHCRAEIESRLYVFPNSALKINNKKINYYEFLTETKNMECIQGLQYVAEHLNMDKIENVIKNTPMSMMQEQFYLTMLKERKEHIISKAYQIQKERGNIVSAEEKSIGKRKRVVKEYVPRI